MGHTVYIVRHGNTFDKGDTVTRVGARTNLPLSSSGKAQASALGRYFAMQSLHFGAAFSSPLLRTMQTAEAIVDAQSRALPIQHLDFLREVDYGPDENKPEADVIARIGQRAIDLWDSDAVVPDGWQVDTHAIMRAWRDIFDQLAVADHAQPTLIVTSNGIARFALKLAETSDVTHQLKLKTGAFGVMELSHGASPVIRDWNRRPNA